MRPCVIDMDRDYPLRGYPGLTRGTTFAFLCVPVWVSVGNVGIMCAYLCVRED